MFKKKSEVTHNCVMSKCDICYDAKTQIYTVMFQSKDCREIYTVKMDSNCIHDFLVSVTMGY